MIKHVIAVLFDKHFRHALELYMTCTSLDVELFFGSLYDLHFCECIGDFLISFKVMQAFPMGNKSGVVRG